MFGGSWTSWNKVKLGEIERMTLLRCTRVDDEEENEQAR
jgi:hypothetical protein